MNLLNKIVQNKKRQVKDLRLKKPIAALTDMEFFESETVSLKQSIIRSSGVIAEFKRRSPSHGDFEVPALEKTIQLYSDQRVAGISVLTDETYFGGSALDLLASRKQTQLPILRKDFVIDEYQIFEAKAHGADAILLIAEVLDDYYSEHLAFIAKSIGLEVLTEFHSIDQLSKLNEFVDIIGVNNRNLDTLATSLETSFEFITKLPFDAVKISESGIKSACDIFRLADSGYDGFLIGESILKDPNLVSTLELAGKSIKNISYES